LRSGGIAGHRKARRNKELEQNGVFDKTRFAPKHFPERLIDFSIKKMRQNNKLEKKL
jgi:hypothetical protein